MNLFCVADIQTPQISLSPPPRLKQNHIIRHLASLSLSTFLSLFFVNYFLAVAKFSWFLRGIVCQSDILGCSMLKAACFSGFSKLRILCMNLRTQRSKTAVLIYVEMSFFPFFRRGRRNNVKRMFNLWLVLKGYASGKRSYFMIL